MLQSDQNLALGQHPKNGVPLKIMLVDDTRVIRMIMKQILLSEKFELIMEAENGVVAIQMLRDASVKPDILFIGKEMPQMDGLAAIKEIRPLFPDLKIIMVTSIKDEKTVREAIENGVTGYIVKPESGKSFERADLLVRIAKILGRNDYVSRFVM